MEDSQNVRSSPNPQDLPSTSRVLTTHEALLEMDVFLIDHDYHLPPSLALDTNSGASIKQEQIDIKSEIISDDVLHQESQNWFEKESLDVFKNDNVDPDLLEKKLEETLCRAEQLTDEQKKKVLKTCLSLLNGDSDDDDDEFNLLLFLTKYQNKRFLKKI